MKEKLDKIANAVQETYGISFRYLIEKNRVRFISDIRMMVMSILVESGESYSKIGQAFQRDHTTVMHAYRTIKDLCEVNPTIRSEYDKLKKFIV